MDALPLPMPRRWLALPGLALLLAIPGALASLAPFRFGYWGKAEPIVVWLHLCSGLGGVGLLAGLICVGGAFVAAVRHPYVIAPFALAIWSALAAPFVSLPLLSLAGVPQNGLGAVWFLDLAVLVACGLVVRADRRLWQLLVFAATVLVAAVAALKIVDRYGRSLDDTILLYVPSYYGWFGVLLPLLAGAWEWRRRDLPWGLAVSVVAVAAVWASFSLTAWVLLAVMALLAAIQRLESSHPVRRLGDSRPLGVGLVAAVAILPPFLLRALDGVLDSDSLTDRLHLQSMVLAALKHEPAWLFGHGWGRMQDALHAHLNVTGENLWRPTWIFLSSDYFSSHNWLLDTVHAAGIPGVLVALAGLLVLPWFARPDCRPAATALAVSCALIGAVWFQLGFSLPFFALAMARVAGPAPRPAAASARLPAAALLAPVLVIQLGLGLSLLDFGRKISSARDDFARGLPAGHAWPVDWRGSDLEMTEGVRDAFDHLAKAGKPRPEMVPAAQAMFAALRARIPDTETVQTVAVGLGVLSYVHFSGELAWLAPHLPDSQALWRPWLERLLVLAPGRSDLAIPYLTARAVAGDLPTVQAFSDRLLRTDGNDAVGHYFRGLVLALSADPAAKLRGIEALRAARRAGIERFLPLDPAILRLIGAG